MNTSRLDDEHSDLRKLHIEDEDYRATLLYPQFKQLESFTWQHAHKLDLQMI